MKEKDEEKDERIFKTAPKRSYNEILNDLYKPIPDRLIKHRKQGNQEIRFIAWTDAVKLMEYHAPGWRYEITKIEQFGEYFFLTVRVTIVTSDGEFYREATGCEKIDKDGWGDPSSNAESMALRRAFVKFGLGIELYKKDDDSSGGSSQRQQSGQKQSGGSNKPTPKQLDYLQSLIDKQGLSEVEVAQEFTARRCEYISQMTFDEVSSAISKYK